jgi:anaerobic selenocysteine-containing dehydrogenase
MTTEVRQSLCRFCHSFCGIDVTVTDGGVVKVVGDVRNPMYQGYSCAKGRSLPEQHAHPDRLLRSVRRDRTGGRPDEPIAAETAMDEIADRIRAIVDEHGPQAVALYLGTFSYLYVPGQELAAAFMTALGSPMIFTPGTIDQPGKVIAQGHHGSWNAGPQPFSEADTWILVGANPLVSKWGGIPQFNPAQRLRDAKRRGMKLVVIDPRATECARVADLHLQCRPGEDPTILAGLIRVIIGDGLYDAEFVASDVDGLEELRAAVEPFTPEYVERRAGVPAADVVAAAHLFASGRRGSVTAGTGPNMAPRGTLTEYLAACIQSLCGRWLRAGETLPNPYVLRPTREARAQAEPSAAGDLARAGLADHEDDGDGGGGMRLRVRGLRESAAGLPTAGLAEEILLEGPGQIRALITLGGNPVAAWPDQRLTLEAMAALDLHVALDIKMSATAVHCDYVIAPKLSLECDAISVMNENMWGFGAATTGYPEPYAQWAPKLVDPPPGSDCIEEWEFFWGVARRLGLQLQLRGVDVDMDDHPTTDDLHQIICAGSRIPLDEVKRHPHGGLWPDPPVVVAPKEPGWPHRLHVGAAPMVRQLAEVAAEPVTDHAGYDDTRRFAYRLISRRMVDVYNSSARDIPRLVARWRHNPAFMHPDDLARERLATGDVVEIRSAHGCIRAIVEAAADVRPGVISMSHAFGDGAGGDDHLDAVGSNTGRLIDVTTDFDPVTGQPRMSAVPVDVCAIGQPMAR